MFHFGLVMKFEEIIENWYSGLRETTSIAMMFATGGYADFLTSIADKVQNKWRPSIQAAASLKNLTPTEQVEMEHYYNQRFDALLASDNEIDDLQQQLHLLQEDIHLTEGAKEVISQAVDMLERTRSRTRKLILELCGYTPLEDEVLNQG